MARVTIEDCLLHVDNRFSLCLLASKRAIQLNEHNSMPKVKMSGTYTEKPTVTALREIALGFIPQDNIHDDAL